MSYKIITRLTQLVELYSIDGTIKNAFEEENIVWFIKECLRVFRIFLKKNENDDNLVSNFVLNNSFLELHWLIEERDSGGKIQADWKEV